MGRVAAVGALALMMASPGVAAAAGPLPAVVNISADRFDISADGNAVTGLRRAPVPYDSLAVITAAVGRPQPVPAAVRLVRSTPPQVIDYTFGVMENGLLVVGQQIRTLDAVSGLYVFTQGDMKRAYSALEATVPWTWILDIPLGREVGLTLEVRAETWSWPVRAVTVTPRLVR